VILMTERLRPQVVLAVLMLIAFALRLPAFFWGLPSRTHTLGTYHPDEQINFNSMEKWNPSQWSLPPGDALYWGTFHLYTLAAVEKIASLTGFVHEGRRAYYLEDLRRADRLYQVARGLSVVMGLLTIFIGYKAGKQLFGEMEGLGIAALSAWIPLQVVATVYAKVDCMLLFWGFLILSLSYPMLEKTSAKQAFLAGLACGLATSTKYTAGIFGTMPLMTFFFSGGKKATPVALLFLGGMVGFALGCPVVFTDFHSLSDFLIRQYKGASFTESSYGYLPWPLEYIRFFLPHAMGWPLTIWSLLSIPWIWWKGDTRDRWLVFSFAITYVVVTHPNRQFILYAVLLLPLLIVMAVRAFSLCLRDSATWVRRCGTAFFVISITWSLLYATAYMQLFWGNDARDLASEWITQHIPAGQAVGVAKSFFWTPPILRDYHSPYRVTDPTLGNPPIEKIAAILNELRPDYFVLSDCEVRDYLRAPDLSPVYANVLRQITEVRCAPIAEFETRPHIGSLSWPKKDPPFDWIYPNPTIRIYKPKITSDRTP
jgi:hypothetical protein